ncbi:hypothetical protein F2Q69_00003198 [Brassica cretica]|uniref:Uncharacterized protein n=1 Tax=Brassica cretica TaxID=69181 RepID=A0A8S9P6E3_BRACR|nr:hypothetical protein F2Q69_00003198 [Brassica cretica]
MTAIETETETEVEARKRWWWWRQKRETFCSQQSQPTFASQPARNSDQPLAKAAARELDKKKTRLDRVRLPQHTSVTRRKTVSACDHPCATRGSSDFGGPVQHYKIKPNALLTLAALCP